jgi:hypothetical protein
VKTLLQCLGLLILLGFSAPVQAKADLAKAQSANRIGSICTAGVQTCVLDQTPLVQTKKIRMAQGIRMAQSMSRSEWIERNRALMDEFRAKIEERRAEYEFRRADYQARLAERRAKRERLRQERLSGGRHSTGAEEDAARRARQAREMRYKQAQKARMQHLRTGKPDAGGVFLENKTPRNKAFREVTHSR